MNKYIKFFISILLPILVWFTSSYFTITSIDSWYMALNKPFFNPPNWIFWPVWTLLYIMIWISFYLVWNKWFWKDINKLKIVYFIQLFLNFLWSFSFFYLENPLYWIINILILWLFIIYNIILFYKVDKKAWIFLVPYLFWVSFASILNIFIYLLN
jgi:tryptophan-rich sensory protein